ncbi:hypothetical protein RFI_12493 [Reticulomyxa filosa]|uniref:Uncharacterized protein n=1 Tax=Reticulomyxa filosa TaxID=46433 RepID=X6NFI5_RETFI|nr:hypothetical protein RFI_12493 [Reticulomyxa filosa]|eukprot:ETO24663.1 hypothetical protein RFI_12493 [Reticulomyxa filosa]
MIITNAMSRSATEPSPRPSYIRPSWDASNTTSDSVASEALSDSNLDEKPSPKEIFTKKFGDFMIDSFIPMLSNKVHHMDSLPSKVHVFDQAVEQILRLIRASILTNFYNSMEFFELTKQREKRTALLQSHLSTRHIPLVHGQHSNHKPSSTSAIASITELLFQSSDEDNDHENDNHYNDHEDEHNNYSFQYQCQYQTPN